MTKQTDSHRQVAERIVPHSLFAVVQSEVDAIRQRARDEYRHEPDEQYTPMLKDIRTLLGQLNVVAELWNNAEKELDGIQGRLLAFVSTAADQGCLRSRRVHCAENESNPADWCVPCQAKFLILETRREKGQRT